ncbi:MAG: NAD+ synthase [Gemmatimonadales bacterium]|nr:NAD+ synthase [Gemmatimonadales bacterium]NIN12906.1 NAD+ synthase [Gemmatimonadales bacterium]NIR00193.1 NAD+ synthase [Gemmatimonadales bacterium]NIS65986.1 NAD+ synthase [Gemmatimonadales bacterium]
MIAQIRPKKADYAENLRRLGGVFAQVAGMGEPPDLIVFPETVLTGYFLEGGVRELTVTGGTLFRDLAAQHALSGAPPVDVALGFYEEFRNRYYNSALYASLGGAEPRIRHVHRKVFLPTYGLFDEERFVEHGHSVRAFDTGWGRAALAVCEDVWHSVVPTLAALDGAQLIIVPSASPARGVDPAEDRTDDAAGRPASVRRWEMLIRRVAEEHGVYVALAQLVGFEGGKGLQGSSLIVGPSGDVLARGPLFEEALLTATLNLEEITRARFEQPLLADLETQLLNLLRSADGSPPPVEYAAADEGSYHAEPGPTARHPIVSSLPDSDPLEIDPALTEQWLVEFLRDEVVRRRGFEKGIVGLSGGIDSSVTATVAARALGCQNVIGVRMPYRTSSPESLEHAAQVAEQLGIQLLTVDITGAVDGYIEAVGGESDPSRRGNVMARMRMITLFDLSMKYQALPLGTGNKTERLLGYFTWHGDDAPPVNPLGDLFKTQVRGLAQHLGVPEAVIHKPATADLVRGQTDEADLGISYDRADRILHWLLRGLKDHEIVSLGFEPDEVALVSKRLHATHWKRRLPTVAMVSSTAIGESYLRPVDY